jgi:hypothetical protein
MPSSFFRILGHGALASTCLVLYLPGAASIGPPSAVRGVVAGTRFTPPSETAPSQTSATYFPHARVCVDANANGACDPSEASTFSDDAGAFVLASTGSHPIVAEIDRGDASAAVPGVDRLVFRAAPEAASASSSVALTPLSTEIVRLMEADRASYEGARAQLARRLGISVAEAAGDPAIVTAPASRRAVLAESVTLSRRFALAAKMVDRHDVSPAARAKNPGATGPAMTMKEAQQAAMALEGIPRYDHIFIITLENKAAAVIRKSPFAPHINAYLDAGNEFTSYYATGNPSQPNRIAASSGEDFGVTDDAGWNCVPEGDTANLPEDDVPAGRLPCVNPTNHNLKHRASLFTAMTAAGLSWRMYNGSMNPGRDWRLNGAADPALVAEDHLYPADSPVGAIGTKGLRLPFPAFLYVTKHNASTLFQDVRKSPDFAKNNRTLGGGQWDDAIRRSPATPAGWNVDQFGADLQSGDVGQLNFLEPDQCDDMHGINVPGTVEGTGTAAGASDCGGLPAIYRGDAYVDRLVKKIQASPIWTNPARRVAIVLMFDEGSATTGFNSCCGWNPSAGPQVAGQSRGPLVKTTSGDVVVDSTIANYNRGNRGHGASVFGVLTNQPKAPKHVVDSDAYSHISFVRTLQDMFQLADPGDDWSYMNRTKYTEAFIAAHLALLPEYADSADPHFDAVRPMNHAYVIPAGYAQKNGLPTPQVGPDRNQLNPWALK